MADGLDKFVLAYTVELKDSIARLEKLNQKVDDVSKKSKDAGNGLKDFAKGAADEIGRLVPGVNAVTSAVSSMGKSFGLAAAAVGALGAGVSALMKMREQYNNQRLVGQDVGVSGMRIEEYQRKLQKNGAGYVTREQTAEAVRNITSKASAAYADPTRMGADAKLFQVLGIDVGAPGKGSRSGNAVITDVATKFASGTEAQAQAWGAQLGLSPDVTKAMRKAGASMGTVTEMTNEEIQGRAKSQQELDKFNDATAKLSEQFLRLTNQLAEKLLPTITTIVSFFADERKKEAPEERAAKAVSGRAGRNAAKAQRDRWANDPQYRTDEDAERERKERDAGEKKAKADAINAEVQKKNAEKNQDAANKTVDAADEGAKHGRQSQDEFQLAVNMFSGAVNAFSNAVDERQAMAAWAGEIGKAAGLSAPGTAGQGAKPIQSSQFDALFEAAAKKYSKDGVTPEILKRIAGVESTFNPNAVSAAGAQGLMQLMPANSKAFGITNPFDPEQNIHGGARLFADYLRRAGGDTRQALRMYHGGLDQSGWGAKTMAYPDKVLGFGGVSASGESKANIRLRQTYENIASGLGVTPRQLQMGGINRGDVTWQANQMEAGLQNKIFQLQQQSKQANLPKTEYDRIKREITDQSIALNTLRENRGTVEDKAREGGRSITVGTIAITVNAHAQDGAGGMPRWDLERQVKQGVIEGLNAASSGNKL
ncbi:lytic transglycosylase domain-containing protein [Cupriavidus pauculus]|uniref:Transglycosylase SLT domain-containing protein n=1 Tax=Cupriavidus pauculus TaxID=82633 RepID=A0A2N5C9I0_9BURK|nr:lytic transglycosylase domain-containing protein [Cupriavidus pauculus]PLP98885.1 hypothetical protein CYJ10_19040 [Cupriavidus pauculus]